jgi:hypothetical protein
MAKNFTKKQLKDLRRNAKRATVDASAGPSPPVNPSSISNPRIKHNN